MVVNLSVQYSVVSHWMQEIRSVAIQKDRWRFRKNMERLGFIAAYEISKQLEFVPKSVQTPMGESTIPIIKSQPVLATILRAGVPLHDGMLQVFDNADCAFVAAYRKHKRDGSFEIEQNYVTCPRLDDRVLIVADPMLATGASLLQALEALSVYGNPLQINIVSAIACTEGIENVLHHYPDTHIWTGDIDEELTAKGYIVPGLGDAGDLAYGSKMQE